MPPLSPWVLGVLIAVLAASWLMLTWLTRSWTLGRRRLRIREWAHGRGLISSDQLPPVLSRHLGPLGSIRILMAFEDRGDRREQGDFAGGAGGTAGAVRAAGAGGAEGEAQRFFIRLRAGRTPASRTATDPSLWFLAGQRLKQADSLGPTLAALRPAGTTTSLVDVLAAAAAPIVWSYPSIDLPTHRGGEAFTIFAGSSADALSLAATHLPGAVPPEVGLLIAEGWLILDFSSLPFDELSLERAARLLDDLTKPADMLTRPAEAAGLAKRDTPAADRT